MSEKLIPCDFLGNEIMVGDEVAFSALGYRMFAKGIVTKIAPKMLFIRYDNNWNYDHHDEETKQAHEQVIDLTAWNRQSERTGRWIPVTNTWTQDDHEYGATWYKCDKCGRLCESKQPYCHCGAHMIGDGDDE